ncbi:MAG: hypothetical protein KIT45_00715 [Fimbriimonadia bacterium]|nr:hypothetical protein [Fimbriimonadia bacterium]
MTVAALSRMRVEMPLTHRNLTLFPLVDDNPKESDYLLMSDALQEGLLVIQEVSESGDVNTLTAINRASIPVLLPDSEELVGAKQNRVLNVSILLPAESTTQIPVSCVEAGRWSNLSRARADAFHFEESEYMLQSDARQRKAQQVAHHMRTRNHPHSSQREVWDDIAALSEMSGSHSTTRAMRDAYEHRREHWSEYNANLHVIPNQVGAIFAVDGQIAGAEMFDSPLTFAKMFPKILRSYAMTASLSLRPKPAVPTLGEVKLFLHRLMETPLKVFQSVGLGDQAHWLDGSLDGCVLLRDGEIVHLYAFPRH